MAELELETEVAVVGAGPGGYVAAFRAADLGLKTVLVDGRREPGGVCLHVGCIPSKALLHVSELLGETQRAEEFGIRFEKPAIDLAKLRGWKEAVVGKLTGGLSQLAGRRGVQFVQGRARFESPSALRLEDSEVSRIVFKHAIVASGARPTALSGIKLESERILDSTGALQLQDIPETLLVVGGGYIGLELGTVYAALGSQITLVELTGGLLPGVDPDLVRPLGRRIKELFPQVHLNTRVVAMEEKKQSVEVVFEGEIPQKSQDFDRVLVCVGRRPNTENLGLENAHVKLGPEGFIETDHQCRTSDPQIFAIGDVAGQPMLAHKASREGKVAAEVIAGQSSVFDHLAIPAVVFTDPEIAWCGLTESRAREEGREVKVARFPWAASSRALTLGRTEGTTKLILDPETGRVLGAGMVGPRAGELIAEGVLAVEMAAVAEDLASIIHPHPTLSETLGEAAAAFLGQATHIYRG